MTGAPATTRLARAMEERLPQSFRRGERGLTFDDFLLLLDVYADEIATRVEEHQDAARIRADIEAALVAASPPLGFELRPDGSEDRESASYVQGVGEVVAAVRRALRSPGDRQAPARPE